MILHLQNVDDHELFMDQFVKVKITKLGIENAKLVAEKLAKSPKLTYIWDKSRHIRLLAGIPFVNNGWKLMFSDFIVVENIKQLDSLMAKNLIQFEVLESKC